MLRVCAQKKFRALFLSLRHPTDTETQILNRNRIPYKGVLYLHRNLKEGDFERNLASKTGVFCTQIAQK